MTPTITYQNYHIHYTIKGSGKPILFLHGWPNNALLWQAQVNHLQTHYKTMTLDWLGFGQSDKPLEHRYTFTSQKEILDAALAVLLKQQEKVTLVAHDIGGPPAVMWASEHEERVERLILLNTICYPFKTPTDALSEIMLHTPLIKNLFVSPFGLRLVTKTMVKNNNRFIRQSITDILAAYKEVSGVIKRKTLLEPLEEGRRNELLTLSKQFKALNIPKYLILAKEDPLCFAHIKRLSQENPEVPAYHLKNCGHLIPIDQAELLTETLVGILTNNERNYEL